jgi:hypothetical protein
VLMDGLDGCRHLAYIAYSTTAVRLVSDLPETRRAFRRASTCERHGSHGRAAARHRGQLFMAHMALHAMCLFLALQSVGEVPTSLYLFSLLQVGGSFWCCAYIYVARNFSLAGEPRSLDVLRMVNPTTRRHAQRFGWRDRVGLAAVFGIGGETSDAVLRWRGPTCTMIRKREQ